MKVPSNNTKTNNATSNANSKMNNNLQMANNSFSGFSATSVNTSVNNYDHKTFIKIIYGDMIDFIDFDGIVKDIPNLNNKDYAIQFLTPTTAYTVLKIELDQTTNEKRYVSLLNELRLNANMMKTINNLNTGKLIAKDKNKQTANIKSKQQQQQQQATSQQQTLSNQTIVTPGSSMSLQHSASSTSVNRRNSNKNK